MNKFMSINFTLHWLYLDRNHDSYIMSCNVIINYPIC